MSFKFVSISVKCEKGRRVSILPNNIVRYGYVTNDVDKSQRHQRRLHTVCGSETNFIANLIFLIRLPGLLW